MLIKSLVQKKRTFIDIKKIKINKKKIFYVKVSNKLHNNFIKLSGDNSPIHTDLKFCLRNNFESKLGHAFLLTTILSKIYGIFFPGGSELCLKQTCNFRKPFFLGDNLTINITPLKKNLPLKLLEIEIKIFSKKKLIFDGEALFQLRLKK